jgi:hypothetical protein
MEEIKDHFQEYMYIYIPIILSLTGLLMTILLFMICCIKQFRSRQITTPLETTRRRRNLRQEPTANRTLIPLRTIPFRPGWEIQDIT